MSEQKSASETAAVTALMRAVACFEADEKVTCRDEMAKFFLPDEKRKKLPSEAYRGAVKEAARGGLYEYIIARTAYFDEIFTDTLREGTPQIVILGAGYDSRAYRFADRLRETRIFEVDAPFTQDRKVSILNANGIGAGMVTFVPVDFEKDDLFGRLRDAGYSSERRTLFLWEGVTLYLSPEAVLSTLTAIKQNAAGAIAFDYLNTPVEGQGEIIRKDERVLFGMNGADIENYLRSLGYEVAENIGPDEMTARFLTDSGGTAWGGVKRTMSFIKAAI